jgi:MFS family permease
MLIAARVIQGIGAGLLTPQTLTMITRIFPPERRGAAMSVWGATAGVATLVGPLAGGVLADSLGWEWIFFVNVPIGVIGLIVAVRLIPELPTQVHRFDLVGVVLSGLGVFLIVFALQEGQSNDWQPWIWAVIVSGIGCMVMFGYWQSINTDEPLIPLRMFADRDFRLANFAVAVIGFVSVAMMFPVMFYAQGVCGLSPTRSALLTAPMPIVGAVLAPVVGKIVDRSHPRPVVGFGFSALAIGLTWLSIEMTPTTPIWRLTLPFVATGAGMAFIWAPLGATATRNLSPDSAGAGSAVFNTVRQIGTVLGSAATAGFMTWQLAVEMPDLPTSGAAQRPRGEQLQLPELLHQPFSAAMSQSVLLPALMALCGVVAALFLVGSLTPSGPLAALPAGSGPVGEFEGPTELIPVISEYDAADGADHADAAFRADAEDTDPRAVPAAAGESEAEPIGLAHNGFGIDDEQWLQPLGGYDRADADDAASYGRHARRDD